MNNELLKRLRADARDLEYTISKVNLKITTVCKFKSKIPGSAAILNQLKAEKKSLTEALSAVKRQISFCMTSSREG